MKQEPFIPECKTEPSLPPVQEQEQDAGETIKTEREIRGHIKREHKLKIEQVTFEEAVIEEDEDDSDDDNYRCPICLSSYKNQNSARPDVCEHRFCLECIEEWSTVIKYTQILNDQPRQKKYLTICCCCFFIQENQHLSYRQKALPLHNRHHAGH